LAEPSIKVELSWRPYFENLDPMLEVVLQRGLVAARTYQLGTMVAGGDLRLPAELPGDRATLEWTRAKDISTTAFLAFVLATIVST
jgi:hypothetical protein